jgi:pimeloyl-ACP methyl ester carboxylesterase
MIYKFLKKPFFGPYMVKWQNPLTTAQQNDWKSVQTISNSGGKIYALFASALTKNAKATIVLGHPMGKGAKGYFFKNGYTDLLRRNGYNTLVFDFNGFGESTHGNFSYFEDIIAMGLEASKLTPNLPIGYFGISLGGQWAIIAFTDKQHNYDFAIIESAATSLDEFWINFPLAFKVLKTLNFILPRFKKKIHMKERIKDLKNLKSILFIYSEMDNLTPVHMGKVLRDNCSVPSELWTIKNATHANIMKSEHKKEYEQKIIAFLDSQIEN